jgi:hypothetical protein
MKDPDLRVLCDCNVNVLSVPLEVNVLSDPLEVNVLPDPLEVNVLPDPLKADTLKLEIVSFSDPLSDSDFLV